MRLSLACAALILAALGCNGAIPTMPKTATAAATTQAPASTSMTKAAAPATSATGAMAPITSANQLGPSTPTHTQVVVNGPSTTPSTPATPQGTGTTTQTPGQASVDSSSPNDPHMQYTLGLINQSRALYGAPPVTLDTTNGPCAMKHAQDLWACAGGNINAFGGCMHKDFIGGDSCNASRENQGVAGGDNDPAFNMIHTAMMNEGPPPAGQENHFSTITNPNFTQVAIAEYVDPSGQVWISEEWR